MPLTTLAIRTIPRAATALLATLSAVLFPSLSALAQTRFEALGILPGADWSGASLLSDDGNIVVGTVGLNSGDPDGQRIFRWTPAGGIVDATNQMVMPRPATPFGLSADGSIIVGDYSFNGVTRGFRLNQQTQTANFLEVPSSTRTTATAVSDDGEIVALYCGGCTGSRAYLWSPTAGGTFTPLPLPTGVTGAWLQPRVMNGAGNVVAGSLRFTQSSSLFRWTAAAGSEVLTMPAEARNVEAYGISADGRTIVGDYLTALNDRRAFRWREGIGGETLIPVSPGAWSRALDVSADGSIIVGTVGAIGASQAYIWTEQRGVVDLAQELTARGADVSGWLISSATAISPDGRTLAGDGFHNAVSEAWRAVLAGARCIADFDDGTGSGTPDGAVTLEDLLYYLDQFAAGLTRADVDDGTGTGTPDGAVTLEDLLYYLVRYDAGC